MGALVLDEREHRHPKELQVGSRLNRSVGSDFLCVIGRGLLFRQVQSIFQCVIDVIVEAGDLEVRVRVVDGLVGLRQDGGSFDRVAPQVAAQAPDRQFSLVVLQ